MLPQYAALEYHLDDRAVHDAVLGDFDADQVGQIVFAFRRKRNPMQGLPQPGGRETVCADI